MDNIPSRQQTVGLYIILINVVCLLLGGHVCAGGTPLKWPTETTLAIAVAHIDRVAQAQNLDKLQQGKSLRAGGF